MLAHVKCVSMSPRKVKLTVRHDPPGKDENRHRIPDADSQAASEPMLKLLEERCSNAEHNNGMDVGEPVRPTVVANPGPTPEARHAPGKGQLQSDSQENHCIPLV